MKKLIMVLILLVLASPINGQVSAYDSNGVKQFIKVTSNGNLKTSVEELGTDAMAPFLLKVAKGEIEGYSLMRKFGQNSALNTSTYEDIWDGGGNYPYPDTGTAPITYIDSDDVDSMDVQVQGLDMAGVLTYQTITLTGTTPVILATPLWRVFRLKNVGGVDQVGNIQAINTADNVIYAQMQFTPEANNQTLMALYTIPLGMTGYMIDITASIANDRVATVEGRLLMRSYGSIFQLKKTFGVMSTGASNASSNEVYSPISALTDIRVRAVADANNTAANTTFIILLIEDGY